MCLYLCLYLCVCVCRFCLCADFNAYIKCQERVSALFKVSTDKIVQTMFYYFLLLLLSQLSDPLGSSGKIDLDIKSKHSRTTILDLNS